MVPWRRRQTAAAADLGTTSLTRAPPETKPTTQKTREYTAVVRSIFQTTLACRVSVCLAALGPASSHCTANPCCSSPAIERRGHHFRRPLVVDRALRLTFGSRVRRQVGRLLGLPARLVHFFLPLPACPRAVRSFLLNPRETIGRAESFRHLTADRLLAAMRSK